MAMTATIEDLGVPAKAGLWMRWIHGRHPKTGAELAIGSLAGGGFVVVDPAARTSFAVRHEVFPGTAWAIGQAPDGRIYQAGVQAVAKGQPMPPLLCWNWDGDVAHVAAGRSFSSTFTLDVAPDGRVYLPEYTGNRMYRFDPRTGRIEDLGSYDAVGGHIHDVACAPDGWVYVTCTDYKSHCLVRIDPRTGELSKVDLAAPPLTGWKPQANLYKDGAGRVLTFMQRWGRTCSAELMGGRPQPVDQMSVRLGHGQGGGVTPLAFADGGYISKVDESAVTYVDPAGKTASFTIEQPKAPLRIFSVYSAAGRIWGGTFIPLTLFAYDPATGKAQEFGNPTETGGEIYSMLYTQDKLFLGSYYGAFLTRYTPGLPWKRDKSIAANPAHLGRMKEDGLLLQRPYGVAMAADGMVYFSACGGYGCEDSGISRIDPRTEEVTRYIYPSTTFGHMLYIPKIDRLLVGEARKGEKTLRATFIVPATGEIADSVPIIEDQGAVSSWLYDGDDTVYGLHDHRATLFAYSIKEKRIVRKLPELGLGDHCHRCLVFGPDDRIWGLTVQCVFSVDRGLTNKAVVGEYKDHAEKSGYRFGFVSGPDGHLYFPNGTHLMRVRVSG